MKTTLARFAEKYVVCASTKCWLWTGAMHKTKHYPLFWMNGRVEYGHRVSYALHVGPVVDGLHVLHSCDNTRCVNPSHLRLGTHTENMRDRLARGRFNMPSGDAWWTPKRIARFRTRNVFFMESAR